MGIGSVEGSRREPRRYDIPKGCLWPLPSRLARRVPRRILAAECCHACYSLPVPVWPAVISKNYRYRCSRLSPRRLFLEDSATAHTRGRTNLCDGYHAYKDRMRCFCGYRSSAQDTRARHSSSTVLAPLHCRCSSCRRVRCERIRDSSSCCGKEAPHRLFADVCPKCHQWRLCRYFHPRDLLALPPG